MGKNGGGGGVAIFFVISGFIIPQSSEGRNPFAFIKSRITRLVPAAWVCATITFISLFVSGGYSSELLEKYIRTIFFVPLTLRPVSGLDGIWVDGVYWTLFVEIAFYSIILLQLFFNVFSRITQLATLLGTISLGYWGVLLGAQLFFPDASLSEILLNTGFKRYFDLSLVHGGAWFGLGINIWLLTKGYKISSRMPSILICLVGGFLEQTHHAIYSIKGSPFPNLAYCLIGIALIVFSVFSNPGQNCSKRSLRICRWIGLTTYPLYLVHNRVGLILISYLSGIGMSVSLATFCMVPVVVSIAFIIAYFVEPPLQENFRHVFDKCSKFLSAYKYANVLFKNSDPFMSELKHKRHS